MRDISMMRVLLLLLIAMASGCGGGGGDSIGVSSSNSLAHVNLSFAVPGQVAMAPHSESHFIARSSTSSSIDFLIPEALAAITPGGIASAAVVINGTGVTAVNDVFNVTPGVLVSRTYNLPVGTVPSLSIKAFSGPLGTGTQVYQSTPTTINLANTTAGAAVPVAVQMTPLINVPPVPTSPDIIATTIQAASVQIAPNDPNAGDTHTYAITTQPANGTAGVNASGLVGYSPTSGFVGTDRLTVTVTDQGGLTGTVSIPVKVTDATPPVITLVGTTPVQVTQGTNYADAGATATDNIDGTITASIVVSNPVNTSVIGAYSVTYDVSDAAGNAATQVARTVNVVAPSSAATYVYVNDNISGPNTVSGFTINQATGALTRIAGSPFPACLPGSSCSGSSGLYAVNNIAVSKTKNLLFASNRGSDTISVFSINPSTGVLTAAPGSPFANDPTATMSGGGSVVVNQSGTLLFVGNDSTNNISVFSVAANGTLTAVTGSPFTTIHTSGGLTMASGVDGIRLNDAGSVLYVTPSGSTVGAFSVSAGGALTPLASSPYTSASAATSIDLDAAVGVAVAAGTLGKVESFTVAAGGGLTSVTQTSTNSALFTVNAAGNQQSVIFTPDGSKVVISGGSRGGAENIVSVLNVSAIGQLSDVSGSPFTTASPSKGYSAVHPNGQWVYVTETGATNLVEFFTMNASGFLTSQGTIAAGAAGSHNGIVLY